MTRARPPAGARSGPARRSAGPGGQRGAPAAADLAALRRQQLAFEAALLGTPGAATGLLARMPDGAAARLDVYRHAHAARLLAALRDNHDVLARAMGDAAFEALGRAYLAAHPSTRPSIRWFGDRLADFMQRALDDGDACVPHAALVDLARLDWALRAAFDAADAPVLDAGALAALPPGDWAALQLRWHPSVALLSLRWAVGPAWHALREAADAGDDAEPDLPAPEPLQHTLLVWRRGVHTRWRSMADDEAAWLAALAAGEPFGAVCALAAAQTDAPEAALQRLVMLLQQWLADGLVSGLARGPDTGPGPRNAAPGAA